MIPRKHIGKRSLNLSKLKTRKSKINTEKIKLRNEQCSFEIVFTGRSNVGKSTLINLVTKKKLRVGRRPGVTLKPCYIYLSNILVTDLPGFGFMEGVNEKKINDIKNQIINYFEYNAKRISIAVHVIDIKSFDQITTRWFQRDEIPIDLELSSFILEIGIELIIVINKIDKITNKIELKEKIDNIIYVFNKYLQNININYWPKVSIVTTSGKQTIDISQLKNQLKFKLHKLKRDDLYKFFS